MLLKLTGTAPFIMHDGAVADPLHPQAREISSYTSKRNKTEDDYETIARLKWASGLYLDSNKEPVLPAANVYRALLEAAATVRMTPRLQGGIIFVSGDASLEYDGPRDPDELWGDGNTKFVDRRMVVVNRQRILAVRPIFPEWAATFEIELDPSQIDKSDFEMIAQRAGKTKGVGDYRVGKKGFYGTFTVELT